MRDVGVVLGQPEGDDEDWHWRDIEAETQIENMENEWKFAGVE